MDRSVYYVIEGFGGGCYGGYYHAIESYLPTAIAYACKFRTKELANDKLKELKEIDPENFSEGKVMKVVVECSYPYEEGENKNEE